MADISNSKLLNTDAGILPRDACIVLVRTEWNASVVDELERGCRSMLARHAVHSVETLQVPGAFETAFAVRRHWAGKPKKKRPDAYIVLGCVIRGATPHFEYVCRAVTDGVVQLNLLLPVPSIFGVLTVDNPEQAADRIGGKHGHKGEEAAITALKMITLNRSLNKK